MEKTGPKRTSRSLIAQHLDTRKPTFFVAASCLVVVKIEERRKIKIKKYNSDVCMLRKQEISMYATYVAHLLFS